MKLIAFPSPYLHFRTMIIYWFWLFVLRLPFLFTMPYSFRYYLGELFIPFHMENMTQPSCLFLNLLKSFIFNSGFDSARTAVQSSINWSKWSLSRLTLMSGFSHVCRISSRISCLVESRDQHWRRKCSVVSSSSLHNRHTKLIWFWLKEALLTCRIYVLVRTLILVCIRGTSFTVGFLNNWMTVSWLVSFSVEISETRVQCCSGCYHTGPIGVHWLCNLSFPSKFGWRWV